MSLFKSFATVGSATLLSRILGFFRDILIATTLGSGPVADAFFVAFRLPNLFRRLFAEGAFNSAFIPLFSEKLEKEGREGAKHYAEEILSGLAITLFIISALIEIFMPTFILLNAPGFMDEAGKFDVTVLYSRVMFPYLFCMAIVAMLSGILNSFGKFKAAAFAPVLLNIILISVLLVIQFSDFHSSVIIGLILSWGVLLAGLAQLSLLAWAMHKNDIKLDLKRPRWNDNSKNLIKLGIPGIISGGITQVNIFIGTIIASLQASAISYLYYADRIYQLPLGIVGIAIGVVLLPTLSRKLNGQDIKGAQSAMDHSLSFAMLLTLPAAVALFVIPLPIITILFERGAFTPSDSYQTALALKAFAIGLPAFVLIKVFSPAFFARKDTKSPMNFAICSVVINITVSFLLFDYMGHIGIALATTIAGWINAISLMIALNRRGLYKISGKISGRILRMVVASLLMAFITIVSHDILLETWLTSSNTLFAIIALTLLVLIGIISFFVSAYLLRVFTIKEIKNLRSGR